MILALIELLILLPVGVLLAIILPGGGISEGHGFKVMRGSK